MNPVDPGLKAELVDINSRIAEKRNDAQLRWKKFADARDHYATKRNPTGVETKRLEDLHQEFEGDSNALQTLEKQRDELFLKLSGSTAAFDQRSGDLMVGKSLGERAAASSELRNLQTSGALESTLPFGKVKLADVSVVELKNLITGAADSSAGAFVDPKRVGYVGLPQRPPTILDLVRIENIATDQVIFARQPSRTASAVEVAEATSAITGTKPEATLTFEKVTADVKTLAHWISATRRALSDAGELRNLIESELRYGLQKRLEDEIVNGDGTGENYTGILNTSGILTQPKSSDSVIDAVHKGITQLRLGNVEPTGVAFHPSDWETVRLLQTTANGYYFGEPGEVGVQTVWGLPAAVTTAVPQHTAIIGQWSSAALWLREGAQVLASDSHSDYFIRNLIALLCEMRAAFGVLRAGDFCKVTGL